MERIPEPSDAVCANCAEPLATAFCGACGQPRLRGRLRVPDLLRELRDKVVDLDRGFLHTVWFAATRPDRVVLDWLHGRRRGWTPPVRFFVYLTAASLAVGHLLMEAKPLGRMGRQGMQQMQTLLGDAGLAADDWRDTLGRVGWAFTALFVPLMAFGLALGFRAWRRTFAEHLVTALYVYAGWIVFSLPLMVAETAAGIRTQQGAYPVLTALMPVWMTWAVVRCHPGRDLVDRIGRALLAAIVAGVVLTGLFCAGGAAVALVQILRSRLSA